MGSELTITEEQDNFTGNQIAALQQMGVSNATQGDLAVFFHQVQRTGLDPFARQIYMIQRQGKQTIQTGIDGFRLIARRASDKSGETFGEPETLWCGPDGAWRDVWLDPQHAPAAAKVVVQRGSGTFTGVALYLEYAGRKRDGSVNSMWASKPAIMLAKCAEALALRKAFPQDLSGLYTSDEMDQSEEEPIQHEEKTKTTTPTPIEGEIVVSKAKRTKIANLMKQGGVDSMEKMVIAFKALTGRDLSGTADLTPNEVDMLLSAPEKVVADTAAALKPKKAPTPREQAQAKEKVDATQPEA